MVSATRRRSVSLAATLVFFVLLFVAGAAVKLNRTGISPSPAAGDEIGSLLARKILRVKTMLHTGSEPDVSMLRQDNDRHQSSTSTAPAPASSGSRLLPAGIVHGTSNLEMEPMVGDPEHAAASSPPPSKSLLAVPVGIKNKAAVEKLLAKFPAEHFAVILFHYDGAVEQWGHLDREVVHVAASGQTKWWFAKRFLHPDVVAAYDYVFLWDEDLDVTDDTFDPLRYLAIVRRESLAISQPALARGSEIHHAITARRQNGDVHRHGGGWVEMMAPVFSREAWRCAWGMVQNDLVHAWGLDYKLGYCTGGDRARHVGVVDSEYVFHRGVPMLGGGGCGKGGALRAAVRRRSYAEMEVFERRWKKAVAEDVSWTDPYPGR